MGKVRFGFNGKSSSYVKENKKKNESKKSNQTKEKRNKETTKEEDKTLMTPGLGKIISTFPFKLCATWSPGAEERNCTFWKAKGFKMQDWEWGNLKKTLLLGDVPWGLSTLSTLMLVTETIQSCTSNNNNAISSWFYSGLTANVDYDY